MYDINLLPNHLQRKFNIDFKRLLVLVVVTVTITAFLGGYGLFLFNLYSARSEADYIDKQLAQMAPQAAKVEALKKERADVEKKVQSWQAIINNRIIISPVLGDLAFNLPGDMWLTGISSEYRAGYEPRGGFASPAGMLSKKGANGAKNAEAAKAEEKQAQPPEKKEKKSEREKDVEEQEKLSLPPNVLVIQGVSYSPASIGVFVNNLCRLPYFRNINVLKIYPDTAGSPGLAFTIEAQMGEVDYDAAKH